MPNDPIVATSKLLSYVLRHRPDSVTLRASQGHSIPAGLQLREAEPPAVLYHATASRFLRSILASGLRAGGRHHMHLSADVQTATRCG